VTVGFLDESMDSARSLAYVGSSDHGANRPAATLVAVSALVVPEMLVEIEADAIVSATGA
jgi:enamine deaminase RidA (YjgF/YER057c/UK114 family)